MPSHKFDGFAGSVPIPILLFLLFLVVDEFAVRVGLVKSVAVVLLLTVVVVMVVVVTVVLDDATWNHLQL